MFDFKFDWDSSIEIGIPKIDSQHKELFRVTRSIEQLILTNFKGTDEAYLLTILCQLREYITYHFYEEECFMREIHYPQIIQHKLMHASFRDKINALNPSDFCKNPPVHFDLLKDSIQDWVFEHILIEDAKFSHYYKTTTLL